MNAWELDDQGNYTRRSPGGERAARVQRELMAAHAAAAAEASKQADPSSNGRRCAAPR